MLLLGSLEQLVLERLLHEVELVRCQIVLKLQFSFVQQIFRRDILAITVDSQRDSVMLLDELEKEDFLEGTQLTRLKSYDEGVHLARLQYLFVRFARNVG